jgi:hypothetical protein
MLVEDKGKAIPVTGRGEPYGCETSRFPHFLDNRLTDGGEVVSLMRRPPYTPQEVSWEPRRLTILWASTASYRDSFKFYLYPLNSVPPMMEAKNINATGKYRLFFF